MPFVKDDKNINRLDTLPENFTKEFVNFSGKVWALYGSAIRANTYWLGSS